VLPELGCPIRRSPDQSLLCGSPGLIAACYVLHRLLAPRHPPFALSSLITKITIILMATQRIVILHALNLSICSCQRTFLKRRSQGLSLLEPASSKLFQVVGVTGFEPVTLRLSSACSNQLSYTPPKTILACDHGRPGRGSKAISPPGRTFIRPPMAVSGAGSKIGGAEETRTPDL
jgi:hypothetical protein